jgi:hypothetical protein
MSQFPHDNFAKNLFELLLSPLGTVNLQHSIRSETKFVDIYFEPNLPLEYSANLGLLLQCLNQHPAMFEPFRNPVAVDELQACIIKVLEIQQEFNRDSKRTKQTNGEKVTPRLWAISPTLAASTELEAKQAIEPEERELIMQLSPLLIEKIEAAEQRGRQEGRQAGEAELVLRLLNRRVGTLSPELQVQIRSLSSPRLEELGEALLDFNSLEDLEFWLDQA